MKKNNAKFAIKMSMLLLSLVVMVFVGSLAWFNNDNTSIADGISVQSQSGKPEFKIAIGFNTTETNGRYLVSDFSRHFSLKDIAIEENGVIKNYNIFKSFKPVDLTGDGVSLYRPTLKNMNKEIDHEGAGQLGVPNQDYIAFDLFFQSSSKCKIYLDNNTRVLGNVESQGGTLVNPNDPTDFSPDAIVGAMRVSFTDYSIDNNHNILDNYKLVNNMDSTLITSEQSFARSAPNALWIPRSDVRFDDTDPNRKVLYTGISNALSANAFYVSDNQEMNTFKHTYFAFDENRSPVGYQEPDSYITSTITGLNQDDISLCEVIHEGVDPKDGNKKCYYGKVHVKIWIEGCDSEARRAMNSGQFIIDFEILSRDYI